MKSPFIHLFLCICTLYLLNVYYSTVVFVSSEAKSSINYQSYYLVLRHN